jgi:hypothetical protein
MGKHGEEQTFPEFAGTNEKMILVIFVFQILNIPGFIYVDIIFGKYAFEVGIAVWQTLEVLYIHHFRDLTAQIYKNYRK